MANIEIAHILFTVQVRVTALRSARTVSLDLPCRFLSDEGVAPLRPVTEPKVAAAFVHPGVIASGALHAAFHALVTHRCLTVPAIGELVHHTADSARDDARWQCSHALAAATAGPACPEALSCIPQARIHEIRHGHSRTRAFVTDGIEPINSSQHARILRLLRQAYPGTEVTLFDKRPDSGHYYQCAFDDAGMSSVVTPAEDGHFWHDDLDDALWARRLVPAG